MCGSNADGENQEQTAEFTSTGPFSQSFTTSATGFRGTSTSGDLEFTTDILEYRIEGNGRAHAESSKPDPEGRGDHISRLSVDLYFTVPVDTTFTMSGLFRTTGEGLLPFIGISSSAVLFVSGTALDDTPFAISEGVDSATSQDPFAFDLSQSVKADTEIRVNFTGQAYATTFETGDAVGDLEFEFSIDFGDRDEDGIPDTWETDGIDIDGNGTPEIDLPAMGANPDKKNLFVEIDAQSGVPFDPLAIAMVEQAFATAPGLAVKNPDGSDGILLHFVTDETDLPPVIFGKSAEGFALGFDPQKADHYGTPSLRARPDWADLRNAYRKVFRYCIWGESIIESNGSAFSGISELPGDDFFVAAGAVRSWYDDPALETKALAGTLMHEFGHALNLRHAGNDHAPNYKPNYLSVMNYAYQMPWVSTTVEGSQTADVWHLDYARTPISPLDENALHEDQGLDGPSGRRILFNTAEDGFAPQIQIADADATEIDWNLSGPPFESNPVAVDLNRFQGFTDYLTPEPHEAPTDWDKIWYPLTGAPDFADGSHASAALIEVFTEDEFDSINSAIVHDRSTPDCAPDVNADGVLDLGDIQAFVDLFLASDLAADFNPDGVLDTGDITAFVTAFLEGC